MHLSLNRASSTSLPELAPESMPRRNRTQEDPTQWCLRRLGHLTNIVGDLAAIRPDSVYEQGPWTALKEIFLATYNSWIYSRIVPNFFDEWYYIDPLSGPGLVRIQDTGDVIAGSAIIAAATARTPFTKILLAEKNEESRFALCERLRRLRELGVDMDFEEPEEDCNVLLRRVGNRLPSRGSNFLAFVDLEGMEVEWNAFSALLSKLGDVIVTFNTGQIQRTWGSARAGNESHARAMDKFYGGTFWEAAGSADDLPEIYLRALAATDRPRTTRIRIHRENPPLMQDILFAARRTRGDNPWFDAVENRIKPKVEALTDESVRQALDIMTGRQHTLDWFLSARSGPQRTLGSFG